MGEGGHLVSEGFTSEEAAHLLEKFGRNELEDKSTPKWLIVSDDDEEEEGSISYEYGRAPLSGSS
jgi:hypothetical protein